MAQPIDSVKPINVVGGSGDGSGTGDAVWGGITGSLSDQTDLQSALNAKINLTQKGTPGGVAALDSTGNVPLDQLPVTVITEVFVVNSEAEMLALTAQVGDVAVRLDESKTYILQGTDPNVLGDWVQVLSPTGAVDSVNGQIGTVVLDPDDLDDTTTTHKFVTAEQIDLIDNSVQLDDPALTDSREWSADTVTQLEAETGLATIRRAWTAQRVFQAIAAWWNGSSAKTKLDGIEAGAEVNQNTFTTINVSGQPAIVADGKTSTLTLAAGSGVSITTNSTTDTVTITNSTPHVTPTINAGNGLTGGGTSDTVTLNVGAGTGITVTADTVSLDTTSTRNTDHSSVSILAGIGLTGGGDLTTSRTLNVAYGTSSSTAAVGNDSRLSDSREWTALTVSQVEAEAGTATTRRAWTAERVRQAIVAWWGTVGTTVGKALFNLTNPSAIRFIRINTDNTVTARTADEFRSDIGAGTGSGSVTSVGVSVPTGLSVSGSPVTSSGTIAISYSSGYQGYTTTEATKLSGIATGATANQTDAYLLNRANHTGTQTLSTISDAGTAASATLTTSNTDTTVGRVLRVGDYGNGLCLPIASGNLNDYVTPGMRFVATSIITNYPPDFGSSSAIVEVVAGSTNTGTGPHSTNIRLIQRATQYSGSPTPVLQAYRGFTGSSWTVWRYNYALAADTTVARSNLGLGNSAVLNTGTTAGTVATGDHTHAADINPATDVVADACV